MCIEMLWLTCSVHWNVEMSYFALFTKIAKNYMMVMDWIYCHCLCKICCDVKRQVLLYIYRPQRKNASLVTVLWCIGAQLMNEIVLLIYVSSITILTNQVLISLLQLLLWAHNVQNWYGSGWRRRRFKNPPEHPGLWPRCRWLSMSLSRRDNIS